MNYVKAYLHANGNNQIMVGKLRMQKINCIISGEREFSQIIREKGREVEFMSTHAGGVVN